MGILFSQEQKSSCTGSELPSVVNRCTGSKNRVNIQDMYFALSFFFFHLSTLELFAAHGLPEPEVLSVHFDEVFLEGN